MQIDSGLLSIESEIGNANSAKELLLNRLTEDGVITNEQRDKYLSDWQFIVVKVGWFKYWKNRLVGNDSKDYILKLVEF